MSRSVERLPLSLVVVAKNEEKHIALCLDSVPFASEKLVVVDRRSEDNTANIARDHGAKVFIEEWRGFGPQKKWAVQQAHFDWVLCLDADERLSEEAQSELKEKFQHLDPERLYYFPRVSFYLGRWIWHGGWFPDFQGRLFHRSYHQWDENTIHERVRGTGYFHHFIGPIEHYVFDSLKDQVLTNIHYAELLSEKENQSKKISLVFKLVFRSLGKFLETYILKQGFRDGVPGFLISVNAAYAMFLRYAFIWEKLYASGEFEDGSLQNSKGAAESVSRENRPSVETK